MKRLIAAFVILLLAACAGTAEKPVTIEERAQSRWDTLLSGDLAGAYEFLSPGYRSSVSSINYQRKILTQPVQWTGATVLGSECGENVCKISVDVNYELHAPVPGLRKYNSTQTVVENWVFSSGKWWFVPKS